MMAVVDQDLELREGDYLTCPPGFSFFRDFFFFPKIRRRGPLGPSPRSATGFVNKLVVGTMNAMKIRWLPV